MKKTKIVIKEQVRTYHNQQEARDWAIQLLQAGVLMMDISLEEENEENN